MAVVMASVIWFALEMFICGEKKILKARNKCGCGCPWKMDETVNQQTVLPCQPGLCRVELQVSDEIQNK